MAGRKKNKDMRGSHSQQAALCDAAKYGDCGKICKLLDGGEAAVDEMTKVAHPDTGEELKVTALVQAVLNQQHEAVKLLLERGAKPNLPDSFGVTPLFEAALCGHRRILQMLLECDAVQLIINIAHPSSGCTPFHAACLQGHTDCAVLLSCAGCDMTLRNKDGETGKEVAQRRQHTAVLAGLQTLVLNQLQTGQMDAPNLHAPDPSPTAYVETGCDVGTLLQDEQLTPTSLPADAEPAAAAVTDAADATSSLEVAVASLRKEHPELGIKKIVLRVRERFPKLEVSSKRVKAALAANALRAEQAEQAPAANGDGPGDTDPSGYSPASSGGLEPAYPELRTGSILEAIMVVFNDENVVQDDDVAAAVVKRYPHASWVSDVSGKLCRALTNDMHEKCHGADSYKVAARPGSHKALLKAVQNSPPLKTNSVMEAIGAIEKQMPGKSADQIAGHIKRTFPHASWYNDINPELVTRIQREQAHEMRLMQEKAMMLKETRPGDGNNYIITSGPYGPNSHKEIRNKYPGVPEEMHGSIPELIHEYEKNVPLREVKISDVQNSMLEDAVTRGNAYAVVRALADGADANHSIRTYDPIDKIEGSVSMLTSAASHGSADVMQILLNSGASIDHVCEEKGLTALHWACALGQVDCVEVLVRAGCDTEIENTVNGDTARQAARRVKAPNVCEMIDRLQREIKIAEVAMAKQSDTDECWICLGSTTEGGNTELIRGCACRGSAGLAHLACLIDLSKSKLEKLTQPTTDNLKGEFQPTPVQKEEVCMSPWEHCDTCKQPYVGDVRLGLARARWELTSTSFDDPVSMHDSVPMHYFSNLCERVDAAHFLANALHSTGDEEDLAEAAELVMPTLGDAMLTFNCVQDSSNGMTQHPDAVKACASVYLLASCMAKLVAEQGDLASAHVVFEMALSLPGLQQLPAEVSLPSKLSLAAIEPRCNWSRMQSAFSAIAALLKVFVKSEQWDEAQAMLEKLDSVGVETFGRDSSFVQEASGLLAAVYTGKGWVAKARSMTQRLLKKQKRTLGSQHPDTLSTLQQLSQHHMGVGDVQSAVERMQEAAVGSAQTYAAGVADPRTVKCMEKLKRLEDTLQCLNEAIGRDGLRPLMVFAEMKDPGDAEGKVSVVGFSSARNEYTVKLEQLPQVLSDPQQSFTVQVKPEDLILSPGSAVGLIDLKGAPELNGLQGEIDTFDAAANRYVVLLESPKRLVRLRPRNCRAYWSIADEKFYALMGETQNPAPCELK